MTLRINDTAPNFTVDTTEGKIDFHNWLGDGWGMIFSHPKDFTPVCATELGAVAQLKSEFDARNCKVIGISVDPVENHKKWAIDIEDIAGTPLNFPIIGDGALEVSKLYDMLPATEGNNSEGRTAADNQTVRVVFLVGPDKKIKMISEYITGLTKVCTCFVNNLFPIETITLLSVLPLTTAKELNGRYQTTEVGERRQNID